MAKGSVVACPLGTKFEEYTGTVKEAEVAMGVCGNVFAVATEICGNGFVPVAYVAYDFAEREVYIHFANETYLTCEMYLEGQVNVFGATRHILQNVLFPALTTSKFVAE